ncbi:MAG TPA: hypothetical protein VGH54_10445 [Mycobacterium sp.]|uniref:hypothetical protein n=1 Tax=Mycobacterium sp. TaxID=1785 RepID=UPI002F40E3EF
MAAPSTPKPLVAGQLATGNGFYRGFTVRETTGAAPAVVQLFDNTAGSGTLLDTIQLPQGTDDRGDFSDGARFVNGIFAVITGTVEGSVFIS